MKTIAAIATVLAAAVSAAEAGADAAVLAILSPRDTIPLTIENMPVARVAALSGSGLTRVNVMVEDICDLDPYYRDSVEVELGAGDTAEVQFLPWLPRWPCLHRVSCWITLPGDTNSANDTLRQFFWVGPNTGLAGAPPVRQTRLRVSPTIGNSFRFSAGGEPVSVFAATGELVWTGRGVEWRGVAIDGSRLSPGPYLATSGGRGVLLVLVR